MHRTIRPALFVAALGSLLLSVGCSSTPAVDVPPNGPSAETVAWAEGVCTTIKPYYDAVAAGPQTTAEDAASAIAALGTFLGNGVTALDGTLGGLDQTQPAPVADGAQVLDALKADLTQQRAAIQEAKTKIDAVDTANAETLATAVPAALEGLPPTLDPTAALRTDPQLSAAADQSATCKSLQSAAAG